MSKKKTPHPMNSKVSRTSNAPSSRRDPLVEKQRSTTYNVNDRLQYYVNCTKVYLQEEDSQIRSYENSIDGSSSRCQNIKIQDFLISNKLERRSSLLNLTLPDPDVSTERNVSSNRKEPARSQVDTTRLSSEKKTSYEKTHQLVIENETLKAQVSSQQKLLAQRPKKEMVQLKEQNAILEKKALQRKEIMRQLYDILQQKEAELVTLRRTLEEIPNELDMRLNQIAQGLEQHFEEKDQQLALLCSQVGRLKMRKVQHSLSLEQLEEKQRKLELIAETHPDDRDELNSMLEFVKQEKQQLMTQYSSVSGDAKAHDDVKLRELVNVLGMDPNCGFESVICHAKVLTQTSRTLQEQNQILEEKCALLETRFNETTAELAQVKQMNQQHVSKLTSMNKDYDIILKEKNAHLKEWQQKTQQQKLISHQLEAQIMALRDENICLKGQMSNADSPNKDPLHLEIAVHCETIAALRSEVSGHLETIAGLNREVTLLQECLLKCQRLESIIHELTDSLKDNSVTKRSLEDSIQSQVDQNLELRSEVQSLKRELLSAQNQIQVCQQQLETQTIQNHLLSQRYNEQSFQQALQVERQRASQDLAQQKRLSENLQSELSKAQNCIDQLRAELKEGGSAEQYEQYILDLNDMVTKKDLAVTQKQNVIEDLQKRYDSLSQQYFSNQSHGNQTSQYNLMNGITNSQINSLLDKELQNNLNNNSLEMSQQDSESQQPSTMVQETNAHIQCQIDSLQKAQVSLMCEVQNLERDLTATIEEKAKLQIILNESETVNEQLLARLRDLLIAPQIQDFTELVEVIENDVLPQRMHLTAERDQLMFELSNLKALQRIIAEDEQRSFTDSVQQIVTEIEELLMAHNSERLKALVERLVSYLPTTGRIVL